MTNGILSRNSLIAFLKFRISSRDRLKRSQQQEKEQRGNVSNKLRTKSLPKGKRLRQ
jgi:hypothetical protein